MVKLQLLECMASPTHLWLAGDIIERDDAEARDLVKAGLAIVIDGIDKHDEPHDKPARRRPAK